MPVKRKKLVKHPVTKKRKASVPIKKKRKPGGVIVKKQGDSRVIKVGALKRVKRAVINKKKAADLVAAVPSKSKKEIDAEYDSFIEAEKKFYDDNVGDLLLKDHEYSSKDYVWRDSTDKDFFGLMWTCDDPVFRWKGYDPTYVTDPISKRPLRRVTTYDQYASDVEWMFKADRRSWFRSLEAGTAIDAQILSKCKEAQVLPVEYYSVYNQGKTAILTSFGADGTTPCDTENDPTGGTVEIK